MSTKINVVQHVRKPSHSKAYRVLLVVLILLLISVGSYAWAVNASHLVTTRTMKLTPSAYDTYVSQYGIMFGFNAQHIRNNPYEHMGHTQIW